MWRVDTGMFRRLVEKELLIHLLDSRFLVVLGLCILLSALSVYVGGRDYGRDLQEHNAVSESNRRAFQETSLDKGRLYDLIWLGYAWKRPPEPLRPLVFGLSGTLGQEVQIRYQQFPVFEASGFETDSIRMLFSLLDFAAGNRFSNSQGRDRSPFDASPVLRPEHASSRTVRPGGLLA